jgi:hypothetical protein
MLAHHRASRAFALSALVAGVAFATTARASGEETKAAVQTSVVTPGLVISQVYGGGSNTGATYNDDYVELFNAGTTTVTVNGLSLQYNTPGGGNSSWQVSALDDANAGKTIPPGGYYLVQFNPGTGGTNQLPTWDDAAGTDLGQASGKLALVSTTDELSCITANSPNACEPGMTTGVLDFVGWGTAVDYAGTGAVGTLSATKAAIRNLAGCTQTLNNAADFTAGTPAPRNSATTKNTCGTTPPVTDAGTDSGTTTPTAGSLVISQVYGGYNYFDSTYDQNFIELFNRGGSPISLSGYSVQTASATGGFGTYSDGGAEAADVVVLPNVTVPAGGYYLIGLTAGTDAGANLPTPVDTTAAAYLNYKSGKVALVQGTAALGCGTATSLCAAGTYVDLVGYGTPSQSEGMAPAPQLGDALSAQRAGAGCTDTNNNAADFTAAAPAARNSTTTPHLCSGTSTGGSDAGTTADSGTSSRGDASTGDDDDDTSGDDDDDSLGNPDASTGGINEVSDANSGGCSTHGRSSGAGGAIGFGLFAAAIVLFVRRRRNRR